MRYALLICLTGILTCSEATDSPETGKYNATLYWFGEYASDGCGFFVEIDSVMYKPDNEEVIDDFYKTQEQFNVQVECRFTEELQSVYCYDARTAQQYAGIHIISISLREENDL